MMRPKLFKLNLKLAVVLFVVGVFFFQYYLVKRIPKQVITSVTTATTSATSSTPARVGKRFIVPPIGTQSKTPSKPISTSEATRVETIEAGEKLAVAQEAKKPIKAEEKQPAYCANPLEYVNLLMGTASAFEHSIGNTLPLVSRPWGFNSWSLQTRGGYANNAWYFHPSDRDLHGGMRCTHQPSPWLGDYLYFNVFGSTTQGVIGRPYSATVLKPHLVVALLREADGDLKMEMTPTMHGAAFRFTFPPNARRIIGIDNAVLVESGKQDAVLQLRHHEAALALEIYAQSNMPAIAQGVRPFWFEFPANTSVVEFRVSTSLISKEVSKEAFEREMPWQLSFDDLVQQAAHEWNELLSRVCATGFVGTDETIFYTNLWRTLLFPRFSDEEVGGQTKHRSPYSKTIVDGPMVTDSGFWDAFSTVYPWLSLSYTPVLGEMIQGWVNSYKESGWLPTWASPYQRGVMVGTMGDATLADAIAKNITGFDRKTALEAIVKDGTVNGQGDNGRTCVDDYHRNGYVSNNCGGNSAVGRSLYYYTADAAIAKAARAMGEEDTAKKFESYAMSYSKQFNKDSGFFQPRDTNGNFISSFNPRQWQAGFTEGSAEQYRFNVPFDVDGLNKLMGGKLCDNVRRLVTLKDKPAFTSHEGAYHEMTEMERQQNDFGLLGHNNQPSHAALYVAFRAGCYELAEEYVRKVIKLLYTKDAWAGDEDNGEMAAWYMLSVLGMYFLDLGSDEVVLGVPMIAQATVLVIDQLNGKVNSLKIEAPGNSEKARVQKITWTEDSQGVETLLPTRLLSYRSLTKGGTLKFYFA